VPRHRRAARCRGRALLVLENHEVTLTGILLTPVFVDARAT
jgi:hypothetical protein